ncbi:MAG: hypothetical protein WC969_05995 [Elusimicrobiota bacterium]|jgi:hypothetical protein
MRGLPRAALVLLLAAPAASQSPSDYLRLEPAARAAALEKAAPEDLDGLFEGLQRRYRASPPAGRTALSEALLQTAAARIRRMPGGTAPAALAANVLRFMAEHVRFSDDRPDSPPRDPHEWNGTRVVGEGDFNGCVEAAKAFQKLVAAAAPELPVRYVGGTLKGRDGGHAVVEVAPKGGTPFLVDTAMFQAAALALDPRAAAGPDGQTLQDGREDYHIRREGSKFALTRFAYRHLFQNDRRIGTPLEFEDLAGADAWLRTNAGPMSAEHLRALGVFKKEEDGKFPTGDGGSYFIYQKVSGDPFDGTERERLRSEEGLLEEAVKGGRKG